jgi:hypothetical protein
MGVSIVDDLKTLSAYGLEESIYGMGDVKGFIDADFLNLSLPEQDLRKMRSG